ncbi:MAG: conjugal transfer protein TraF [Acidobacteria bacterium]|nr:conjugal transfer protein TraF [Acidobacteriota bacterium]MCA1651869.1 conjugal transfer protein TraF [Acidobacteriota bacterium]
MKRILWPALAAVALGLIGLPLPASAQSFESMGTRAAGMAGAFVAVADDASAVYWNPGALAAGSYFSLVLDRQETEAQPEDGIPAGSRSGTLIALSAPALGLSYYRLRATIVSTAGPLPGRNGTAIGDIQVEALTTHHLGATVVQSLTDRVAVGATLKLVRGAAVAGVVPDGDPEKLLGDAGDLDGEGSSRFDGDIGILGSFGSLRAGLTVRNLTEPGFETARGGTLRLARQARAGVSYVPVTGLLVAADADLTRTPGPFGDVRSVAVGGEARVYPRAWVRAGLRLNTIDHPVGGRTPVGSVGGSYAVFSSLLLDAHLSIGGRTADRGWGLAGRVVF